LFTSKRLIDFPGHGVSPQDIALSARIPLHFQAFSYFAKVLLHFCELEIAASGTSGQDRDRKFRAACAYSCESRVKKERSTSGAPKIQLSKSVKFSEWETKSPSQR
jgi:hypothetical protein